MISKSLSTSRKFAELSRAGELTEFCQLLFPLLVSHADDYGRLSGDAFTVKFQVFPISPRPVEDFERAIAHLDSAGLIQCYEANGDKFIQVSKFDDHQTGLHKRSASKIPEPPGNSRKFPEIPGQQNRTELNRREEELNEKGGSRALDGPRPLGDKEALGIRAGEFMDYYRDKHEEHIGIAYMGNPIRDYEAAMRLVAAFSDDQLQKAALVWLGMDDDFATSGTRTVPKFASRITACLERMKQRGIA
jgi:hypothetical protein